MESLLWQKIQSYRLEIVPLDARGLHEAIIKPAEDVGVFVEAALVERLVLEAAGEPGVLPLIQETLLLLWEKVERRFLPLRAYESLVLASKAYKNLDGSNRTGLQIAIANRADVAVVALSKKQQQIARRIFLRLIQFGEGRADTRRQQSVEQLCVLGEDARLFDRTLFYLADCRLLTLSGGEEDSSKKVDIAHEALIEGWPALQWWLTERREAEQTRRLLMRQVEEWIRLGKGSGGLLDEAQLAEAGRWLSRPDAEELGYDETLLELVEASDRAIQRQLEHERKLRQKAQELARKAIISAVVAFTTAIGFFVQWNQAIQGEINTLTALSDAYLSENRELEALLTSVKAGKNFKKPPVWLLEKLLLLPDSIRIQTVATLAKAVYEVQEFNRLEGHSDSVWSVSFSPDGQKIASASDDGTIKLWSNDGKLLWNRNSNADRVTSVSFSPNPDNEIIVSGSRDNTVKLWDENGNLLWSKERHSKPVNDVSSSHKSKLIASASDDRTIKLWNKNGELIETLKGHGGAVTSVSFSPDGQTLASASWDKTVKLWNLNSYQNFNTLNHSNLVNSVSFSPDGQILVSASEDGTIKVWSKAGEELESCEDQRKPINDVSFSKDGETIASASEDNTVKLWSIENGTLNCTPLKTLEGHGGSVKSVSFSPNGDDEIIASASDDNTVRLWNPKDNPFLKILKGHSTPVSQVSFSADSQTLASVSIDGMVKIWSFDGEEPINSKDKDLEGYYLLDFAPKNRKQMLVLASEKDTIELWDLGKSKKTKTLRSHGNIITSLKFSSDGKKIASASWDKTIKLWNIEEGGEPKILESRSEAFTSLDFSPDSQMLALASENNTIKLWRLNEEKPTTLGSHEQKVTSVSFSPDGKIIASASKDKTIKLWSLEDQEPQTLIGHNNWVTSVSFSPDGKIIASASDDETVKLWNRAGEELATFKGRGDSLSDVNFSSDGKTLVAASRDGTVILWNLELNKLFDKSCDWLSDYLKTNPYLEKKDRDICR